MKKGKKIAILTQPLGKNYGGILQNFALQYVLKNLGYSVITISREYEQSNFFKKILITLKNETINRIFGKYRPQFTTEELSVITKNMNSFINENIFISNKIYTTKYLREYFKQQGFDAIIIGSDQTWRPMYSPNIYNYYLDFLKENKAINKIAYASSFGTEDWEYNKDQTNYCKELIKEFNYISVREDSGVVLCKDYLDTEADLVLDPTLLLSGDDYINILNLEIRENRGLYNYVLDKDPKKHNFIKMISNHLNLGIYNEQPKRALDEINNTNFIDDFIFPSPINWLQGFLDADFVITDSFHGTVFSILFKKRFIALINEGRGSTRFKSILGKIGLEDRLISNYDELDLGLIDSNIDYDDVYKKLDLLKNTSMLFLSNALKK